MKHSFFLTDPISLAGYIAELYGLNEAQDDINLKLLGMIQSLSNMNTQLAQLNIELSERVLVLERRTGHTCQDEGCPHYGTPHAHPKG